jgi:hypothetical protein
MVVAFAFIFIERIAKFAITMPALCVAPCCIDKSIDNQYNTGYIVSRSHRRRVATVSVTAPAVGGPQKSFLKIRGTKAKNAHKLCVIIITFDA